MESMDDEADLIDSFFLPGGILDPEGYEEGEKAAEAVFPPVQPAAQTQLLPTTSAFSNTSFPPAINPNNPWAQTGNTTPSATPAPPISKIDPPIDQTQSFFQSNTPFQLPSVPPRVDTLRPPLQAPPGFERPQSTSFTDDESIQSIPRELMQEAKSSYAGSSTSSLSGSSVDEGEDEDDDEEEPEEADVGNGIHNCEKEEVVNHQNGTQQEEDNFHEGLCEANGTGNGMIETKSWNGNQAGNSPEDGNGKSIQNPDERVTDNTSREEPFIHVSPSPTNDVDHKDGALVSSPSQLKPKARKRRGARKPKSQQSPIQVKEKKEPEPSIRKIDPNPEKKPITKHSTKESKPAKSSQHDFWKECRIVVDTLTRDSAIVASFCIALYRAALDEALGDTVALGSYLFFRYCPMLITRIIVKISLPHWTSHLVTMMGVWQICTPAQKDRTGGPLRLLRLAAVMGFVVDGFSQEHAFIMMIPGTVRMLLVFLLMMVRGGYWGSSLLWFSLMIQILFAFVFPFDQILIIIGLASLNYKRNLALKMAVLKASKT